MALVLMAAASGLPAAEDASPSLPPRFHRVTDWLYRGGQPSKKEIRTLAEMGIRTIVDLRQGDRTERQRLARDLGMNYVALPMSASHGVDESALATFLEIVDDPNQRPVFVHCREGRHRTGILIGLYRVLREGMSADEAYAEMQRLGFGGRYPNLRDYLYATAEDQARSDSPESDSRTEDRAAARSD